MMSEKDLEFLENMEKELASLSQDELYELLVDCGLKGLKKLDTGEGRIVLDDENPDFSNHKRASYELKEMKVWNNKESFIKNEKNYYLAA